MKVQSEGNRQVKWKITYYNLDLTILDRFGHPVRPREWFLVPFHVIDEAVKRILDGSISNVIYDPETASLVSPHP